MKLRTMRGSMPASSGELRLKPSSNGIAARLLEGANMDAGTKELLAPAAITPRTRLLDKLCIDLDATMLVPCDQVVEVDSTVDCIELIVCEADRHPKLHWHLRRTQYSGRSLHDEIPGSPAIRTQPM
jgi:hypothetical protein